MAESRRRTIAHPNGRKCLVEGDLPRRRREQVLATQHVRDPHERVVYRVYERVERLTIPTHEHVVGHVLLPEGDLATDEVIPGEVPVRHLETQNEIAALGDIGSSLGIVEIPALSVVSRRSALRLGEVASFLELGLGAVARVGIARITQPRSNVRINIEPLGLAVWPVGTTNLGALVPGKAQPAQCIEECVVGLLTIAGRIGVLDAEDKGSLHVTRE